MWAFVAVLTATGGFISAGNVTFGSMSLNLTQGKPRPGTAGPESIPAHGFHGWSSIAWCASVPCGCRPRFPGLQGIPSTVLDTAASAARPWQGCDPCGCLGISSSLCSRIDCFVCDSQRVSCNGLVAVQPWISKAPSTCSTA